jgi:plastocyanin
MLVSIHFNPLITPYPQRIQNSVSAASITIVDYAFRPTIENVSTGTNVVWTYVANGSDRHTVTSKNLTQTGSLVFASTNPSTLLPGQSYNFTFYMPGRYAYYCAYHPSLMNGWINVTGAAIIPPVTQPSSTFQGIILPLAAILGAAISVAGVLLYGRRMRTRTPSQQAPAFVMCRVILVRIAPA